MKTVFNSIVIFGLVLFFNSCQKESEKLVDNASVEQMGTKAGNPGCSATCFWSSCSISNCSGTATCGCVNLLGVSFLGSTAVCNCTSGQKKTKLSAQNIIHHEHLQFILAGLSGTDASAARSASADFVQAFNNDPDDEATLEFHLQRFRDAMSGLTESNARAIQTSWSTCDECESL